MLSSVSCPTCSAPTLDGVCQACAFSAALAGLTADDPETGSSVGGTAPTIEGYDLLHRLGAGATAVVWLARERKLDRLVALKLITPAADHRLVQRLIREGQAAARLRHPHIVPVHALSATGQGMCLVMDFLPGGDLRQRLARGTPEPRRSAEWIHQLAGALAHAHANSLLHRDIKPSNVLLDDAGEPHLADFGLAAPLEGAGDLTSPGQIAGTAAYLAPELLAGADRASVASDIYGLGAVMYECLAGRPPFLGDSTAAIFAQLAQADPPAPRLLRPDLPRDLETICLKCLEKSPERRYASATALQEDLGRYLRHEPIAARPPSAVGQAARWCRRNPNTAIFAAATGVLLLGLAIGGPVVAVRLAQAHTRAREEAASSQAVSEFLRHDLLAQAAPEQEPDRNIALRTVLDRAAGRIDGRFEHQPLVESDLRDTLAATYFSLGELAAARAHWQRAHELRARLLGHTDRKTLATASHLFDTLRALGDYPGAEALGREVLDQQRRALGHDDPDTLLSMSHLAIVHRYQGRFAEAEALYTEALERQRRATGAESPEALTIMNNLAVLFRHQRKLSDAEVLHASTLESRRRVLGPEHPDTLHSLSNLSLVYKDQGRLAEAEPLAAQALAAREHVLGTEHPHTLISMMTLGAILQDQAKLEEAEALCERAFEIQLRRLGPDHADTLNLMNNLGTVYRDRGKLAEAEQLLTDTLARRRRVLGNDHLSTLNTMGNLVRVYQKQQRPAEARALLEEALSTAERVRGPSDAVSVRFSRLRDELLAASETTSAAP